MVLSLQNMIGYSQLILIYLFLHYKFLIGLKNIKLVKIIKYTLVQEIL